MLISESYAAQQRALHSGDKGYGESGAKWAFLVDQLARNTNSASVLDYGAGPGTLKSALLELGDLPYAVHEYDPCYPGKEERPEPADLVVCGDVLEHIEPECLYSVLDDIRALAKRCVFLVVATRPAKKTLPDGRNAHLIIERASWWIPKLNDRWDIKAFNNIDGEFMLIGGTRGAR